MSFQTLNSSQLARPIMQNKLSEVITDACITEQEGLSVNFRGLVEMDTIPEKYREIGKLNVSHNLLKSLDGVEQFRKLTQISFTHNKISTFNELFKIPHPENIKVISVAGNPFALHLNLEPLLLQIFPNLIEIDGVKITDHTRQDITDALILSKRILSYFYKNEQILVKRDIENKKYKLKIELFQKFQGKSNKKEGPFWEEINAAHSRELRKIKPMPRLPNYSYNKVIRPYMILNYIDVAGKALQWDVDEELNEKNSAEIIRVFKWLFCEILLQLHSWGHDKMQKYLQFKAKPSATVEEQFEEELKQFYLLGPIIEENSNPFLMSLHFSDIFPNTDTDNLARKYAFQTNNTRLQNLETNKEDFLLYQNLNLFPIFGCYSEYLKAIFVILQNQINSIQDLQQEKEEILRLDFSAFGLPSLYAPQFTEGIRSSSEGFDKDRFLRQSEKLKNEELRISGDSENSSWSQNDVDENDVSRYRRAKPLNRGKNKGEINEKNRAQGFLISRDEEETRYIDDRDRSVKSQNRSGSLSEAKTEKINSPKSRQSYTNTPEAGNDYSSTKKDHIKNEGYFNTEEDKEKHEQGRNKTIKEGYHEKKNRGNHFDKHPEFESDIDPNIDEIMQEELDQFELIDHTPEEKKQHKKLLSFYHHQIQKAKKEQLLRTAFSALKKYKNDKDRLKNKEKELKEWKEKKTQSKLLNSLSESIKKKKQKDKLALEFQQAKLFSKTFNSIRAILDGKNAGLNKALNFNRDAILGKIIAEWKAKVLKKDKSLKDKTDKKIKGAISDSNAITIKKKSGQANSSETKRSAGKAEKAHLKEIKEASKEAEAGTRKKSSKKARYDKESEEIKIKTVSEKEKNRRKTKKSLTAEDKMKAKADINSMLNRIAESEGSIAKLWALVRKPSTKSTTQECNCGNYLCEICTQERADIISKKISDLQQDMKKLGMSKKLTK
ncbi:unnamed protein product [Blepharisma stoltei]|uniref:Uncharacterized protein n=1 Tax=Blepharisma stoltei TaxID=1481888 RepID=A0AAU9KBY3_9CILI|nr:unnamed protein product [Blepharisma stoltei]